MSPGILDTFEAYLRAELGLHHAKTVVKITIVLITIPHHGLQHRLRFPPARHPLALSIRAPNLCRDFSLPYY